MKDKIAFFNGRSLFNGIVISYMFFLTKSSFWISGILGTIIGAIIIYFYRVRRNKLSTIIVNITVIFMAFSILINMGHSLYLKDTPVWFLALFPSLGIFIMSRTKKTALTKVVHILFIYSLILFFLAVLGLIPHVEIDNMRPLWQENIKDILYGAIIFALAGIVPIIGLNDVNVDKKNILIYYIVSEITILVVSFFSVTVLGIKEVQLYRFPEYVVLKRIEFLNFVSNVDSFFNFAIIVDILLTATQGLKNIENETDKRFKDFIWIIITIITIWACYYNWPLLLLYQNIPYVLIGLFILLLIPKIRHKEV